jgi:hypothetical protein
MTGRFARGQKQKISIVFTDWWTQKSKFQSFGVQFLAKTRVMSPAIFFWRLARKKCIPKNHTPEPPTGWDFLGFLRL